ncbi:MAG: S41 family peptidase [Phycisphaerales bacterium JB043]
MRQIRIGLMATAFAGGCLLSLNTHTLAQDARQGSLTGETWASRVWSSAQRGDIDEALRLINRLQGEGLGEPAASLRDSLTSHRAHFDLSEQERLTQLDDAMTRLEEHDNGEDLEEALRIALEIQSLSDDPESVLGFETIERLLPVAEARARDAESEGDWFESHELFYRLNLLFETDGRYREDVRRLGNRLTMLRLYVPEQLHEMRNERRVEQGLGELPPYNPLADDWRDRLKGIDQTMVIRALTRAESAHVDGADMAQMLVSGLYAIETMVTTSDLKVAFPGLGDEHAVQAFVETLDAQEASLLDQVGRSGYFELTQTLRKLEKDNKQTVDLPYEAILHEFGNGAFTILDDFTSFIWPDEQARFLRSTEGRFTGVGIQIQLDDAQQLYVVTPLEGTPAQRAGIRPGDFIRAVDGESTIGISSNQAVDRITGPKGTKVVLTIERDEELIEVPIVRDVIPLYSVKGWKRVGVHETDWDWFVDQENSIGYVRLTQFSEDTTRTLRQAILDMKREGLEGLVLDLRFNPGGLLSQAVGVSNVFVDAGVIVSQHDASGVQRDSQRARPGITLARDLPVVVLINEGTASASEIVAGCLQDYSKALVVGARSYGKGSVQNVYDIGRGSASLKLTTQYYKLPGGRLIHRRVGQEQWGIEPDVLVEMRPQQISEALRIRQDADVLPIDEHGNIVVDAESTPDPQDLLEGVDLQLETALLLLRSQVLGKSLGRTSVMLEPEGVAGS